MQITAFYREEKANLKLFNVRSFYKIMYLSDISILPKTIHSSWFDFFTDAIVLKIKKIESEIVGKELVTPSIEKMLRFFELDLTSIKVIIIGQDPYPQEGVATGRAFEVGNLESWFDKFPNTSLKNIVRALYVLNDNNFILKFNDIKEEIKQGKFKILSPQQLFKHWEKQGVLMINSSFSVIVGNPGSHAKIWESFTNELLRYINSQVPEAHWMLWGAHAKGKVKKLTIKNKSVSRHPMLCSNHEDDFLFGKVNHFRLFKDKIDWGIEFK